MTSSKHLRNFLLASCAALAVFVLSACGGGGGGGSNPTSGGGQTIAQQIASCEAGLPQTPQSGGNTLPVVVDAGPCAYYTAYGASSSKVQTLGSVNIPYTSVVVCAPTGVAGQTPTNCQTIDHVMIDTGSSGLRILSSALNSSLQNALPNVTMSNQNLYECVQFAASYSWGSVRSAFVGLAGDSTGANAPTGISIQVIGDSENITVPTACNSLYPTNTAPQDTVDTFGANGVLGVGLFIQDCGVGCTTAGGSNSLYYLCPSTNCSAASSVGVTTQQVSNPVSYFGTYNNGVILTMDTMAGAVGGGALNLGGTLTLGINSAVNNQLTASQSIFGADTNYGTFNSTITSINGTAYASSGGINTYYNQSFIDSGSNAVFYPFDNTNVAVMLVDGGGWFAPTNTPVPVVATMQGAQATGPAVSVSYGVNNADTLFGLNSGLDTALNGLSAPNPSVSGSVTNGVDWGLPFFYGRSVYVLVEQQTIDVPYNSGNAYIGPLWAF